MTINYENDYPRNNVKKKNYHNKHPIISLQKKGRKYFTGGGTLSKGTNMNHFGNMYTWGTNMYIYKVLNKY